LRWLTIRPRIAINRERVLVNGRLLRDNGRPDVVQDVRLHGRLHQLLMRRIERSEKAGAEWRVNGFEELQEDEANRVPLWE
jgi:hypothetical protein